MKSILVAAFVILFFSCTHTASNAQTPITPDKVYAAIEQQPHSPIEIQSFSVTQNAEGPPLFRVGISPKVRSLKTIKHFSVSLHTSDGERVMTAINNGNFRPGRRIRNMFFHVPAIYQSLIVRTTLVVFADKNKWVAAPFKPIEKKLEETRLSRR